MTKTPAEAAPPVRLETRGPLGLLTLNRPDALNALSLEMIRILDQALQQWGEDPGVHGVVVRGAGERAFCAGGDVRAVCRASEDDPLVRTFFREEYRLNRRVHRFPKPYIALLDGITMGGGVGISVHGSHRVATERTVMAMPETGIGFFPDVGTSYLLPRLPDHFGFYLGLTGARLGPGDAVACGLATHFVPVQRLEGLLDALVGTDWEATPHRTADAVLAAFSDDPGPTPLWDRRGEIDACFRGSSVTEILDALRAADTGWAEETLATLETRSPTSLEVTLRLLRETAGAGLEEALQLEYRLSQRFRRVHDFCEGVRAAVVDKDHAPQWDPPHPGGVAEEDVAAHFRTLGADELTFCD